MVLVLYPELRNRGLGAVYTFFFFDTQHRTTHPHVKISFLSAATFKRPRLSSWNTGAFELGQAHHKIPPRPLSFLTYIHSPCLSSLLDWTSPALAPLAVFRPVFISQLFVLSISFGSSKVRLYSTPSSTDSAAHSNHCDSIIACCNIVENIERYAIVEN